MLPFDAFRAAHLRAKFAFAQFVEFGLHRSRLFCFIVTRVPEKTSPIWFLGQNRS